jgi:hypothetical protein
MIKVSTFTARRHISFKLTEAWSKSIKVIQAYPEWTEFRPVHIATALSPIAPARRLVPVNPVVILETAIVNKALVLLYEARPTVNYLSLIGVIVYNFAAFCITRNCNITVAAAELQPNQQTTQRG